MSEETCEPQGELVLRTSPMPCDTNVNGDIFGGWIMSQMDIAGGMMAREIADGRAVTIAVDSMKFIEPVQVGDTVCCYGSVVDTGTTSITMQLEVWVIPAMVNAKKRDRCGKFKVTEARFVFVAIDDDGNKRKLPGK